MRYSNTILKLNSITVDVEEIQAIERLGDGKGWNPEQASIIMKNDTRFMVEETKDVITEKIEVLLKGG